MALAARSSAEPRTACPVCGGSIHPIAGKCKHCKSDLVKLRRQQHAAAATPAPGRSPYARPAAAPVHGTNGVVHAAAAQLGSAPVHGINGAAHAGHVAPGAPVVIAAPIAMPDPYATALPPPPRGAWSRSWPIVVAVIAAGAIVVSVILLLTGGNERPSKTERVIPQPAPDRMSTDPLPSDPWQGANPGGSGGSSLGNTAPAAPDPTPGAPTPTPAPSAPPPPPSPAGPTASSAPPPERFNSAMFQAVCDRYASCGLLDSTSKQFCDEFKKAAQFADTDVQSRVASGECTYDRDKAASCMGALQGLPCTGGQAADLGALSQTIVGVRECMDVLACH